MSFMTVNTDIEDNGYCGGGFSRRVTASWATGVAPTKTEQGVLA